MPDETLRDSSTSARPWLVRIPEVFAGLAAEILSGAGAAGATRLGPDYYLLKSLAPDALSAPENALFVRWQLPMDHTWPCHAREMDGFIEKAAQTLARKFAPRQPQGVFIGQLNPGSPDRYYKSLASNLRGRTLQLFPGLTAAAVEDQNAAAGSLFCLVGKEGLFCGFSTPRAANGWYPGGSKFMALDGPDTISRAGAKLAEALHYLPLHRPVPAEGAHWLELGACPGGMTFELLTRGQRVTAVDRAPLDRRLQHRDGLTFVPADVADYTPPPAAVFDAMLSDLNGPPDDSLRHVLRLSKFLRPGGLVIFTLKLPGVETLAEIRSLFRRAVSFAAGGGLRLLAQTHLTSNRREFTLFFERSV